MFLTQQLKGYDEYKKSVEASIAATKLTQDKVNATKILAIEKISKLAKLTPEESKALFG